MTGRTTQADTRYSNGTVLLPGGLAQADVLVRDGRVAAIAAPGEGGEAAEMIDCTGLTIVPGAIDAHIHLGHGSDIARPRVPGDAASETGAAARGGVTCVISYVMSSDPHVPAFDELIAVTQAGAWIDFGFHFVIATEAQLTELPELIARGAPSAKLFMNIRGNEGARLGLPGTDDGFMYRLLEAVAAGNGVLCPHPENIEIAWVLRDRMLAADPEGTGGLATWNATRPPLVEAEALQRILMLSRATGTRVHAVHTSSGAALAEAVRQRQAGADVSIETCIHYLTHDETDPIGVLGKVNPPLRSAADREALWQGIRDGHVDTIATDHIHRPTSSKHGGIWKAQPGFPGLDTFLPALLTEGHVRRGIPLPRLIDMVSRAPARAMGLGHKGAIRPGADADLAVIDLNARWTVDKADLATDAGCSIYEGREMRVRVVHTVAGGRTVLRDGALDAGAVGTGRFVPRTLG